MPLTNEQVITEARGMIVADTEHLAEALGRGDRVHAHRFVDAIIDNLRLLVDTQAVVDQFAEIDRARIAAGLPTGLPTSVPVPTSH